MKRRREAFAGRPFSKRSEGEDEDEGEGVQQQDGGRREVGEVGRMYESSQEETGEFALPGNWPSKAGLAPISYFLTLQITSAPHKPLPPSQPSTVLQNCRAATAVTKYAGAGRKKHLRQNVRRDCIFFGAYSNTMAAEKNQTRVKQRGWIARYAACGQRVGSARGPPVSCGLIKPCHIQKTTL